MDTETKLKVLAGVAILFGIYMILDGFGSILVYWRTQPLFPDHFVRICRMIAGLTEIVLAIVIVWLWGILIRAMRKSTAWT